MRSLIAGLAALLMASIPAWAQEPPVEFRDDVSLDTYLAMLSRVSPVARDAADAYMAAFAKRCGRALQPLELRKAFAEGNGNPSLLAMIRATATKDADAVQRAAASIGCAGH